MHDPQTATLYFFGPLAAAYLLACAGWLAYDRFALLANRESPLVGSTRPRLDFLLAIVAAAGIFALGAVYRQGWLLPAGGGWLGRCNWLIDNLVIYFPIALVLAVRRQGPDTLFLSSARLPQKIGLGLGLGALSLSVYSLLRGEADEIPARFAAAVTEEKLIDFLPVFLEGVAVAFLFVRLRWMTGTLIATVLPAMLFAAAHVPGQIAEERTLVHMAMFFLFNCALSSAILWTVARSRDVVWIGLVHYLLDVAIEAI